MKNERSAYEAVVEGVAEDLSLPKDRCLLDGMIEPCSLVIIGASGDLTARKLVP